MLERGDGRRKGFKGKRAKILKSLQKGYALGVPPTTQSGTRDQGRIHQLMKLSGARVRTLARGFEDVLGLR